MSLSAIDGNTAWAVGISKQGSSQTPAGWRTINGTDWGYMSLPSGTGGAMQYTIPTQVAFLDANTGWMSGMRVAPMTGQENLIWRTTSAGMGWDELYQAPEEILHLQVTHDWAMFAVGGSTVVRTQDGATFVESKPTLPSGMGLVGIQMFNKDCGYAVAAPTEEKSLGYAVLWTSDGAETWSTRSQGHDLRFRRVYFISPTQGWAVGTRGNEGVLAKTTDGAKTWTFAKAPAHPPFFNQEPAVTRCEDVRFFDDQRGVALCLCCTGNCEPEEGQSPSYLTSLLRTYDGGQTWSMDMDYEAKMAVPPFPEMSKASGMLTMSFPDPNHGFMAGQNNIILRYEASQPEAEAWPAASCESSSGTGGTGTGGVSQGSDTPSEDKQNEKDEGGCGCRVAPSSRSPLTALLFGIALLCRRRRTNLS